MSVKASIELVEVTYEIPVNVRKMNERLFPIGVICSLIRPVKGEGR